MKNDLSQVSSLGLAFPLQPVGGFAIIHINISLVLELPRKPALEKLTRPSSFTSLQAVLSPQAQVLSHQQPDPASPTTGSSGEERR